MTPITSAVVSSLESESDISVREILSKIYVLPKLFWTCLFLPPLVAILLTALIPATYEASVKILIRYSASESAFMQDLIPEGRALLSGASSAEIVKSIPTLAETVRRNNIEDEEISKKSHEVLMGYVSGWFEGLFTQELPEGLPGIDPKTLILAKTFQESIDENIEILEAGSGNLPVSLKGDELISITVPSFKRERVAEIANGLAEAFIDQYYQLSADDARRAYQFLDDLVKEAEGVEATNLGVSTSTGIMTNSGKSDMYRLSPRLESTSIDIAELETELANLKQIYKDDAKEVRILQERIEALKSTLSNQELSEVNKGVLSDLKLKRYQAYMTEKLYSNRLVPINIIEPAFTPKKSMTKLLMRFVIAGIVGSILGFVLAVGLITVLSLLDQRLFTSWDYVRATGKNVLRCLPFFEEGEQLLTLDNRGKGLKQDLFQILGAFNFYQNKETGRIITVNSISQNEGKTFLAKAISKLISADKTNNVLLIDANFSNPSISRDFGIDEESGLIDVLTHKKSVSECVVGVERLGCSIMPVGSLSLRDGIGFYGGTLKTVLHTIKEEYDVIVVESGGCLNASESLMFSAMSDINILVVESGKTKAKPLKVALKKYSDVGAEVHGLVVNKYKQLLPDFLYRLV